MPRISDTPVPKKRFHGGRWRIYWKWNFKQYSLSTPYTDQKKTGGVNADLRLISAALVMEDPEFPEDYASQPAVLAYKDARLGDVAGPAAPPEEWLGGYMHEITGRNTPGWVRDSKAMLTKLEKHAGGFEKLDEKAAAEYMATIAAKRTAGTHNRTLTVFKKFYTWTVNTKRHVRNPFQHIKRMNETKDAPIVYCTQQERDEIIAMAKETGWPEWLAVPIAFYAGMRREEIANLRWEDLRLDGGNIVVAKTKTGVSRTLPLNAILAEYLEAIPPKKRKGFVVDVDEGDDRVWRLNSLAGKIKKMKRDALLKEWDMPRPRQSKSKEYKERRKAWERAKKARNVEIETALERIGWNAWRHTFGSLLAQAGVSLDKISAWMGNTPEVCRRHYAQFIPRDRRDGEIDKL